MFCTCRRLLHHARASHFRNFGTAGMFLRLVDYISFYNGRNINLLHRNFTPVITKTKFCAAVVSISVIEELLDECATPTIDSSIQPAFDQHLGRHRVSNAPRGRALAPFRLPYPINTSPFSTTSRLQLEQTPLPLPAYHFARPPRPRGYQSPIFPRSTSERRGRPSSIHNPQLKSQPRLLDDVD